MDVRELMARLTASGLPLAQMIRSTGPDRLEQMEIAAALGMIAPRHAAMLLAQYAADEQQIAELGRLWALDVADQEWSARPYQARGYVAATMGEHLGIGTICAVCHGTAQREISERVVECHACDGRGRVAYTDGRYQLAIQCSPLEWDRVWRQRVRWGQRALAIWELDAVAALSRQLSDRE